MLKAGIWGVGGIANMHANALKYSGVELIAVVDNVLEVAKDFASNWQVLNYGVDKEILFASEIDTVHVCTPPNLHYEMVKELLLHGKNVICEKPLCFVAAEAKELAELASKNNLKVAVNFNVRYHVVLEELQAKVQDSSFGKLNLIHGNYLQAYHLLPTINSWRYNEQLAGSMRAVTEIGSHFFDIIQYITKQKITAVSAKFGKFNPKRKLNDKMMEYVDESNSKTITINSEDAAIIMFTLTDGSIGSVVLSEVSHGRQNELAFSITGDHGSVNWNTRHNNEFTYAYGKENLQIYETAFGNSFEQTFTHLIADFYATKSSSKLPSIKDASYLVEVCNAVYESANDNAKWIAIEGE